MRLTSEDRQVLDLVAAGNVWRDGILDLRRGPTGPIVVPTGVLIAARLAYVKPCGRLGLTWAGKKVRAEMADAQGVGVSPLDDSGREEYRLSLLAEVVAERFGRIPWSERHRKPVPREVAIARALDTPRAVAYRVRVRVLKAALPVERAA